MLMKCLFSDKLILDLPMQPLMLIVPDVQDVYTPLQTDVIVQLSEVSSARCWPFFIMFPLLKAEWVGSSVSPMSCYLFVFSVPSTPRASSRKHPNNVPEQQDCWFSFWSCSQGISALHKVSFPLVLYSKLLFLL